MKRVAAALVTVLGWASAACSPASAPLAPRVAAQPAVSVAAVDPAETSQAPPRSVLLAPLPNAVPEAPGHCGVFTTPLEASASTPACEGNLAQRLDAALAAEAPQRDARLRLLERCTGLPAGWVRALRAELAPMECADEIVAGDLLEPRELRLDVEHLLSGMGIAARLARLEAPPPALREEFSKQEFLRYFREEFTPWVTSRANAIAELAREAAKLEGYGRGVAAVEAAVADLRFIEVARSLPLPADMKRDSEIQEAYYGALDEALEPRKLRARDAALAGLAEFARLGVLTSSRMERVRAVLAQSYSGHRIDALDGLLLPALPAPSTQTREHRLASRLPTFFFREFEGEVPFGDPTMVRALLEQGLSPSARERLDASALSLESAELYARGLFGLGQRYWRTEDFVRAAEVAALVPARGQQLSDTARLLEALAQALRAGPGDARRMLLGGPLFPDGLGNVGALDLLAEQITPTGAMAAYDAAHLLELVAPSAEAPQSLWLDIAERYERAARGLPGELVPIARERAVTARETARAVSLGL